MNTELKSRAPAIRLDANRLLSLQAACFLVKALVAQGIAIEYIEEPCASLSAMEYVYQASGQAIPIGLDESLDELWALAVKEQGAGTSIDTGLSRGAVAALVLKPTLLGGVGAAIGRSGALRCISFPLISSHFLPCLVFFTLLLCSSLLLCVWRRLQKWRPGPGGALRRAPVPSSRLHLKARWRSSTLPSARAASTRTLA